MTDRRRFLHLLATTALAPVGTVAVAQTPAPAWPTRPLRIVVPFAAGGNTDAIARLIASKLGEQLGQNVIVENRPGGNGVIGSDSVAKAPGDGYSLLIVTPSHAINPLVNAKLPYDTQRDFVPVSLVSRTPYVVAVGNDVPATDMRSLVAYAKANPGKLSYASSGIGTGAHLTTELFKLSTGIDMLHVTYKGTAVAMPDVISGRVSMIFDVEQVLAPLIRGGKVRGFAITGERRSPTAPEIPTMAESGVPGFVTSSWVAMFTSKGTPAAIAERIGAETRRALEAPDVRAKFTAFGAEVIAGSPADLDAFMRAETEKWGRVARHIGLKPE